MGAAITGWGSAIPEGRLTNADLTERIDVSEDWIVERTGVRERRIAASGETTSSLASEAGRHALKESGVEAGDLDMVIVATVTPDYQFPAVASLVQTAIGATQAGAFDLAAGCSGFLFALAQAGALVDSGTAKKVLLCGAETLSRIIDYTDERSCVLFGDGAGAVVVEAVEGPSRVGPFTLHSDGSQPELLWVPPGEGALRMQGREVYRRAVDGMTRSVAETLEKAKLDTSDVALVVAHQANARILDAVATRLGFPSARVVNNIERYGNTSSASIPIALCEALELDLLADGDNVVFTAFGAGLAWGAGVVRWGTGAGVRGNGNASG